MDGGTVDGIDLASKATYGEGAVGSEEYDFAEAAIMAIEVDGIRYDLPEAKFENLIQGYGFGHTTQNVANMSWISLAHKPSLIPGWLI